MISSIFYLYLLVSGRAFSIGWSLALLLFWIADFPKTFLGKSYFRNFPCKGIKQNACRTHSLKCVKWSEVISCHTFLHKENVNQNLKFLFNLLGTRMHIRTLYSESCGFFFFSFLLRVSSILLNSTFIFYIMFRCKTFFKQYAQWGLL